MTILGHYMGETRLRSLAKFGRVKRTKTCLRATKGKVIGRNAIVENMHRCWSSW